MIENQSDSIENKENDVSNQDNFPEDNSTPDGKSNSVSACNITEDATIIAAIDNNTFAFI